jgi:hypothetical protein
MREQPTRAHVIACAKELLAQRYPRAVCCFAAGSLIRSEASSCAASCSAIATKSLFGCRFRTLMAGGVHHALAPSQAGGEPG